MYVVDSHCDSIQQVAGRNQPLVNPYNVSQKYNQLQMYAMFCGWPGEDAGASYKRATRYMGVFSVAIDNESDKIVKVKTYADIERAFAEGKHAAQIKPEKSYRRHRNAYGGNKSRTESACESVGK